MSYLQREFTVGPLRRGFHVITPEVVHALPELREVNAGLLHLFIQHTSASLTLNERASPDARVDFESWFARAVPDGASYFRHTLEGDDDMAAHIKSSLLGSSVSVPVSDGSLALGVWQGIYLCEHRDSGGPRTLMATVLS